MKGKIHRNQGRKLKDFIQKYKYELLLFALLQHLFIGIFLTDLPLYTGVIWPANMLVLGVASIGVYMEKGKWKNIFRNLLFIMVFALPLGLTFFGNSQAYYLFLNISYVAYFIFIFYEIIRFLVKPSYINQDIILASACGYLLLIEISTFFFQYCLTQNPGSFNGIDTTNNATVYMDFVYFSSITMTSIGYGDISPASYFTKLAVAIFGIVGQFYTVVLVGILISKFTARQNKT